MSAISVQVLTPAAHAPSSFYVSLNSCINSALVARLIACTRVHTCQAAHAVSSGTPAVERKHIQHFRVSALSSDNSMLGSL